MEMQKFTNSEFGSVRTLCLDGDVCFVGKDVADILGYSNVNKAIQMHVDDEDKKVLDYKGFSHFGTTLWSGNDFSNKTIINESGLYSLVLSSKLPTAKKFKHWITSEVLPSIRKHGVYAVDEVLNNPDMLISALTELKAEREKRKSLETKIEADKPKTIFADAVAVSDTSILVGDLAKIIKQNGVDIGANRLFAWLRENGYLISRKGTDYNSPTQKSMDLQLFEIKETVVTHSDGHTTISKTPKVTGKGQVYFVNKFIA